MHFLLKLKLGLSKFCAKKKNKGIEGVIITTNHKERNKNIAPKIKIETEDNKNVASASTNNDKEIKKKKAKLGA